MSIWVVRAGKEGEVEKLAIRDGFALIGWGKLPDLTDYHTFEEIRELIRKKYGKKKSGDKGKEKAQITNDANQILNFKSEIEINDICILPCIKPRVFKFGRFTGEYVHLPENPYMGRHGRSVSWVNHILRTDMPEEFRKKLAWRQTVFQVSDEDTVNWIEEKMNEFENANLH